MLSDLFLLPEERANPHARVDATHPPGVAWSTGNAVRPLVHGAPYFAELHDRIEATGPGDLVLFADWRADPDERLTDDPDHTLSATLTAAARRGVAVRGLLWRSHDRALGFHAERSRQLGLDLERAGGECLRDMRVAPGGSHHQKFVVIRHADDPSRDIAYVGGIDLCRSRRDTAEHDGDPQPIAMPQVFGPTPAWHDVHCAVQGPAVHDIETTFRERWEDSTPLTLNPGRFASSLLQHEDLDPGPLPDQQPPPPSPPDAHEAVQVLRTYPALLAKGFDFAPDGEQSIARANDKAVRGARRLVYLEDQYLWSEEVGRHFGEALRANPELRLVAVIPIAPDVDGAVSLAAAALRPDARDGPAARGRRDRVALYGLTSPRGYPVYVHSKVCIIDDRWASVGSDNFNRRSWTNDSELSVAVQDDRAADAGEDVPRDAFALRLRRELVAEHVGIDPDEVPDDPDLAVGPHGRGRRCTRRLVRRRGAVPGPGARTAAEGSAARHGRAVEAPGTPCRRRDGSGTSSRATPADRPTRAHPAPTSLGATRLRHHRPGRHAGPRERPRRPRLSTAAAQPC